MFYSMIKPMAIEDGIGCRVALFVSGCRHHCYNCFQPQTWSFNYGQLFTDDTINTIITYLNPKYIDGLTVLGGEPFEPENQENILHLLRTVNKIFPNKTIWIYSGCTFEELTNPDSPYNTEYTKSILNITDILVDGPFIEEQKNLMLPFRGSENQRVLDCKQSIIQHKPVISIYNERIKTT